MVRGDGTGGPNQEFALALALELEGIENWVAFAVDTDGGDGPTDAAGGLVSGETAQAIREGGLDPEEALENNDAYAALEAGGALLITGPTGTNVNDLRIALVRGDLTGSDRIDFKRGRPDPGGPGGGDRAKPTSCVGRLGW